MRRALPMKLIGEAYVCLGMIGVVGTRPSGDAPLGTISPI